MSNIDTSKEGFEYVGIKLTDEQFNKLFDINLASNVGNYKNITVFQTVLVLKALGLIPKEMSVEIDEKEKNKFERITGRRKNEHRTKIFNFFRSFRNVRN